MTYSLQIEDGDLKLDGSQVGLVTGTDKLLQDLNCWLCEKYQSDRFHSLYGSTLDNYVGTPILEDTAFRLRTEAIRVLTNYQQIQLKRYQDNPDIFGDDELLADIISVDAKQQIDTIFLDIKIVTVAGTNLTYTTTVGI